MAVPVKKVGPQVEGVNFGDLGMYVAGFGLPDGDYCLFFDVRMYQAKNAAGVAKGPQRLGVMVSAYDLADPRADNVKDQFYSMGSNADKSFAPNPETGKGLVAIPGAPGTTLNHSTNWALFLKSLYDSGLPQGVFTNDFTTIDGMWVHTQQVEEPEERKGFQSQTGEAAGEAGERKAARIAIVTEIKDEGKPWEGTGGLPAVAQGKPAPAAPAVHAVPAKGAPKVNGKPQPAPPPPAEEAAAGDDAEALYEVAANAVTAVLGDAKNANGCTTLKLRTETFASAKKLSNEVTANKVLKTFFTNDDALNGLLGPMGYVGEAKVGGKVEPISA